MEVKAYLETAIFPRVRGDGGWLDIEEADAGKIALVARGECAQCACLDRCLEWIGESLRRDLGMDVEVTAKKRPFVWRR